MPSGAEGQIYTCTVNLQSIQEYKVSAWQGRFDVFASK